MCDSDKIISGVGGFKDRRDVRRAPYHKKSVLMHTESIYIFANTERKERTFCRVAEKLLPQGRKLHGFTYSQSIDYDSPFTNQCRCKQCYSSVWLPRMRSPQKCLFKYHGLNRDFSDHVQTA